MIDSLINWLVELIGEPRPKLHWDPEPDEFLNAVLNDLPLPEYEDVPELEPSPWDPSPELIADHAKFGGPVPEEKEEEVKGGEEDG